MEQEIKVIQKDKNKIRKIQIVLDILLIILIIASLFYYYTHIEYAKAFIKDPCAVCEEKTGGVCSTFGDISNLLPSETNENSP